MQHTNIQQNSYEYKRQLQGLSTLTNTNKSMFKPGQGKKKILSSLSLQFDFTLRVFDRRLQDCWQKVNEEIFLYIYIEDENPWFKAQLSSDISNIKNIKKYFFIDFLSAVLQSSVKNSEP